MRFGKKNNNKSTSKSSKVQKNMETLEIITSPERRNKQECGTEMASKRTNKQECGLDKTTSKRKNQNKK